ncbi:urea carboxylase-associated family protein [Desulfobacterales bacterium]|nr:urea carboxylase-associated family protein [Desulfobacterales bacterium]
MKINSSSTPIKRFHIGPQSGTAFTIQQGQIIRIIDVEGEQVSDLFCFAKDEVEEHLSSGHTTDYNGKLFLSKGDTLYSNRSNPMFTIVADQVGKHIMLYAPCSQEMFVKSYEAIEAHPNCLDNLVANLMDYGIQASTITIPLNIFMNIEISRQGKITIQSPLSKAGDYIELKAEMNMIVGVTACSAGKCNNFKWTPIDVEVYSGEVSL